MMCVYVCAWRGGNVRMCTGIRGSQMAPGAGATGGCEFADWCWDLNSSPA